MKLFIPKYNRAQQRAIVVLGFVFLITSLIIFLPLKSTKSSPILSPADSALIAQVHNFENHLANQARHDSLQQSTWEKNRKQKYDSIRTAKYGLNHTPTQKENFTFNPNTLDSAGFVKLGFKPYIAKNIIRYRSKGGKFNSPSDLLKIYNIDSSRVRDLLSYIRIEKQDTSNIKPKLKTDTIININTADTATLKLIPFIAKARAAQIVYYRNRLGGFISPAQILEACNSLSQEQLEAITKQIYIDSTAIKKIPVNRSSVERLKAHPYINFYQAKKIYELRWENNGKLNNINDLLKSKEISPDDIKKLEHYLSFE